MHYLLLNKIWLARVTTRIEKKKSKCIKYYQQFNCLHKHTLHQCIYIKIYWLLNGEWSNLRASTCIHHCNKIISTCNSDCAGESWQHCYSHTRCNNGNNNQIINQNLSWGCGLIKHYSIRFVGSECKASKGDFELHSLVNCIFTTCYFESLDNTLIHAFGWIAPLIVLNNTCRDWPLPKDREIDAELRALVLSDNAQKTILLY